MSGGSVFVMKTDSLKEQITTLIMAINILVDAPKITLPIYFHGNYNGYREHNNTVG